VVGGSRRGSPPRAGDQADREVGMTAVETGSASSTRWPGWFSTVGRLVLGGVWIAAGLTKVTDLDASVRAASRR